MVVVNPDVAIYVPAGWGFGSPDPDTGRKLRKGHRWLVDGYHPLEATTEIADDRAVTTPVIQSNPKPATTSPLGESAGRSEPA